MTSKRSHPDYDRVFLRPDAKNMAKAQASLEGKKLVDWMDEVIRREYEKKNGKKSMEEYRDYRFF